MKRNKNKKNYYERNTATKGITKPILVAYIPYIDDQIQLKNVENDLTSKLAGQYHVLVVSIPIQTVAFEVLNPRDAIDTIKLTEIKDHVSAKIQLIIDARKDKKDEEKNEDNKETKVRKINADAGNEK